MAASDLRSRGGGRHVGKTQGRLGGSGLLGDEEL